MARPTGQLEKSLAALTIAMHEGLRERQAAKADAHTGEHVQQIHVPLSGSLAAAWGYSDRDVNFLLPFLYAPSQRQVPFDVPHFTYGVEFVTPPSDLVLVQAHVLSWRKSEESWITGARVRFTACAPNASAHIPFNAMAHLSFEGYATYAEGEEFDS